MKIAVFIKSTTFHKGYGGLETQCKVLCEGLVLRGHDVTIFAPKKELSINTSTEKSVHYVFVEGDYYNKNNVFNFMGFGKNSWFENSVVEFEKEHKKHAFDLVVSQSAAGLGIILKKKSLEIPVVSIAHGTTLSEYRTYINSVSSIKDVYWILRNTQYVLRQYFGRQRKYILGSDKVIAVSNSVKTSLLDETFVDKNKVAVIHNGIDPQKFNATKKSKKNNDVVKLVYVGRIEKSKGIFDLIKIFQELPQDNISLEIVGDGVDLDALNKLIVSYSLTNKVFTTGNIPHDDVIEKLQNADIFVFPSLRVEGFPMTIVEAMLCELPVVASDIGGISDAIESDVTGYLLTPSDTTAFKETLTKLINDLNFRKKMGENARIKALKEFTIDVMLNKYEKIFSEVLKNK